MSRRKHLVLQSLQQEVQPPGDNQHIVRTVGSRGSNIIEVEYPDGRSTLALLPAKFHKKLWVKKGSFVVVEGITGDTDARGVTAQILQVLYADHVKQLKRMDGVWPHQFNEPKPAAAAMADGLEGLSISDSDEGEVANAEQDCSSRRTPSGGEHPESERHQRSDRTEDDDSSEGDLPPLEKINNRRQIVYEVSDSDSDDG